MNYYFAGFYCDATDLAENTAKQRPINIIFIIIGVAYIFLVRFLWLRIKTFSKWKRVAIYLLTPLFAVVGFVGYLLISFISLPHWC